MTDFWNWALAAYHGPGVSEACLALQDTHGQNVPLLLWAAWTAATGRVLDEEIVEAACDAARAWEGAAIAPLRAVRRTLKAPIPDIGDMGREALREQVKTVELAAERALMTDLETLAPEIGRSPSEPLESLIAVARAWTRVTPRAALATLAERLPT